LTKRAVSTISRNLAAIKSFYQYLVRERYLEKDPAANLESPKLEKKLPKILSIQEIEELLKQQEELFQRARQRYQEQHQEEAEE